MFTKIISLATIILSLSLSLNSYAFAKGEDGNLRCYGTVNCDNDTNCKKQGYIMVSTEDECLGSGGKLTQ